MENRLTIGLIAVFGVIVASLLVGARLGFAWAGGDGYKPQQEAHIVLNGTEGIVTRGQTIRTKANERAKLQFNSTDTVWMDENTDLTVVENTIDRVAVHLGRGRLYATRDTESGPYGSKLNIETNATSATITSGALFVVNYDFLGNVAVAPVDTSVQLVVKTVLPLTTATSVLIHETKPIFISQNAFDPQAAPAFMQFIRQ